MITLDLSTAEKAIIRDVLGAVVSDLGMEIAATDSQDFRNQLKERREAVRKLLSALDA